MGYVVQQKASKRRALAQERMTPGRCRGCRVARVELRERHHRRSGGGTRLMTRRFKRSWTNRSGGEDADEAGGTAENIRVDSNKHAGSFRHVARPIQ